MTSLKTDPQTNDLLLDSQGNLRLCEGDEALLQDVGAAMATWKGEVLFNPPLGVDYDGFFLKNQSSLEALLHQMAQEGRRVPGVKAVKILYDPLDKQRGLNGKVQITKTNDAVLFGLL